MKLKMTKDQFFTNQKGTTLIELMISVTISAVIILTAATVLQQVVILKLNASKRTTIEDDLDVLLTRLQQLAKYGVNVRYANNVLLDGRGNNLGQGFVRRFDYRSSADLTRPATTLMFFARESTRSRTNTVGLRSRFLATAVFFRAKVESPINARRPAALVIDSGRDMVANEPLEMDDSDYAFDYISDVVLDNAIESGEVLQSIRMTVSAIYPLNSTSAGLDCYGPTEDIADGVCDQSKPYKLLEKSVILSFLNNKRRTPKSSYEFSEGFYMFLPSQQ